MENKQKKIGAGENTSFTDIVDITYLTPENTFFSLSKNGFLEMISSEDVRPEELFEEDGEEKDAPPSGGGPAGPPPRAGEPPKDRGHGRKEAPPIQYTPDGRRNYGRVLLHRAFPFDHPDGIISVLQEDGFEIGIIRNISDFDEKTAALLRDALDKTYFIPEITRIYSTKDRFGFVYFKCATDKGDIDFVLRNPFGSIIRLGEHNLYLLDVDGNRYHIPDVSRLDRKSYRKIELYL